MAQNSQQAQRSRLLAVCLQRFVRFGAVMEDLLLVFGVEALAAHVAQPIPRCLAHLIGALWPSRKRGKRRERHARFLARGFCKVRFIRHRSSAEIPTRLPAAPSMRLPNSSLAGGRTRPSEHACKPTLDQVVHRALDGAVRPAILEVGV